MDRSSHKRNVETGDCPEAIGGKANISEFCSIDELGEFGELGEFSAPSESSEVGELGRLLANVVTCTSG